MNSRRAITRTEVLIVIGILALIVGLILPGISRVREAAIESRCKNNLKSLGLGFENYLDTFSVPPPFVDQGEGARTGKGLPSFFASIMPFLESRSYYFNPEKPPEYYHAHTSVPLTYQSKKDTTFTTDVGMANEIYSTFIDPADATAEKLRDVPMKLPDGTTGYYATGSYAANGNVPSRKDMVLEMFRKGTANTIVVAERPQVCNQAAGPPVYNLWGVGFYSPHMPAFAALTPVNPPGLASTGQVSPAAPWPDENAADRDTTIRVRIGRRDAIPVMRDFVSPIQYIRPGQPCDPRIPGTPHRGGMQVAMADGSVRTFGLATSPWVFWSACSPTGRYDD